MLLLASQAACAAAQSPAPPACDAAEHRALDFWVGEWDAYTQDGDTLAGRSTIALEDGGCVVTEHWRSVAAPYSGRSLNLYDRATGQWEQYWVDSTGDRTHFVGGLVGTSVQMTAVGDVSPQEPDPHFSRVTFTPQEDGTVLQVGEASADGKTWETRYAFVYRRRTE